MWIYTKAVICNGQNHMDVFRHQKKYSIMEASNGVCARVQEPHDWISEFSLVLQENKILEAMNFDVDVPCALRWVLLWYSAPTSLSSDLLNDGAILETNVKNLLPGSTDVDADDLHGRMGSKA